MERRFPDEPPFHVSSEADDFAGEEAETGAVFVDEEQKRAVSYGCAFEAFFSDESEANAMYYRYGTTAKDCMACRKKSPFFAPCYAYN